MSHLVEFPKLGWSVPVNEVAFSIGSFQVRWYGVIIAFGFLLAVGYAGLMSKRMNISMDRMLDAVLIGVIGAVVCARLFYVLFYPGDTYRKNPAEIFNIHNGGLAIYGGVIGAMVFGGLTARLRHLKVFAVLDVTALGFLIGQCIGRWGNFVNQEAFGAATDLPWGMVSDNTRLVVPNSPVHPCFLYESLLCLLGFFLLHFFNLYLRRYDGQTFLLYVVWYGCCRFFIEGLRTDSLIIPYTGLRVSQVLAAVSALTALVLLVVFRKRTSLSGCGSQYVREAVGMPPYDSGNVEHESTDEQGSDPTNEDSQKSSDETSFPTIFGNPVEVSGKVDKKSDNSIPEEDKRA